MQARSLMKKNILTQTFGLHNRLFFLSTPPNQITDATYTDINAFIKFITKNTMNIDNYIGKTKLNLFMNSILPIPIKSF